MLKDIVRILPTRPTQWPITVYVLLHSFVDILN